MRALSRRAPRGSGRFVVLIGPDGVGKTTVARAVVETVDGPTAYFHFRPLVLSKLLEAPPTGGAPNPDKGREGGLRALGWLRIARNFVRLWAGYLIRVRPARARGVVVLGDRWGYGYLAQPLALKFYGPPRLAATVIRMLPSPDLVVNLAAPPEVIAARKDELTPEQIVRELEGWRSVPARRMATLDATAAPADLAQEVVRLLGL